MKHEKAPDKKISGREEKTIDTSLNSSKKSEPQMGQLNNLLGLGNSVYNFDDIDST
jgi:hypothetical protein